VVGPKADLAPRENFRPRNDVTPGARFSGPPVRPVRSQAEIRQMTQDRFQTRLAAGQLAPVTRGAGAQRLKLADQYKLAAQGDVARRMELEHHVPNVRADVHLNNVIHHENFYSGHVGPTYVKDAFEYHYYGPHYFAGVCWYPHWNPWVDWSWHYNCYPVYDPRPVWCRPVVYDPCPAWAYYPVPVWAPLPAVACGTWVDARPILVAANDYNLQLLAVRFVDPGHPEEKLGPRFRVWYRNNSPQPIMRPFNVTLLAGLDRNLVAGLPQAGVRVISINGGDTQSVDVRMPWEVVAMGRDYNGNPVPFSTLHVLVDANREIPQSNRSTNGTVLPVAEVLPVDPASFELEPLAARSGSEVLLAGEGFGPEAGQALVHVAGQEVQGEILGWYDLGVRMRVPNMIVAAPVPADVVVVRGDGAAANPLRLTLVP
jgi:hypothetical protein